jgi:two-component system, response regulator
MNEHYDILLVEDNQSDAELAMYALRKNNIANSLLHLQNGEELLDYIFGTGGYQGRNTSELPRLILLDLKMPKVSGLEALKKIKADERARLIPVVLLTSSKEDRDIARSYELGVNSYIVKPVEFEDFERATLMIGRYWLSVNESPK